jgi:hypothetical protein
MKMHLHDQMFQVTEMKNSYSIPNDVTTEAQGHYIMLTAQTYGVTVE